MRKPLISIVVPAYNYGRYLPACIDSLLSQTYREWELIVVDNGSIDDTWEVLARYDDPRITKLRIDVNEGPIPAWDMGYRQCRGEYFALLPADDFFKPEKLERQVAYLNDNPEVTAVATYIEEVDNQGKPPENKGFMEDYINQEIDYTDPSNWRWRHYFCIPSALYSKELCDRAKAVPDHGLDSMCDWDFHVKLIGGGVRFAVIPEKLTCYRWHQKNTSLNSKNAYREWVYSYTKNYLPVIQKTVAEPFAEMALCIEVLFQNPYFISGYSHGQHCAMLELMLHPEKIISDFPDFKSFHAYSDTWEVNSVSRAALASVATQLIRSCQLSNDLITLQKRSSDEHHQMLSEFNKLRKQYKRVRKTKGFFDFKYQQMRSKIKKAVFPNRHKP